MFVFSLVSISLMSLSLLVVMLAVSLASIFIISSSMGLLVLGLDSCTFIFDILLTICSLFCVLSSDGAFLGDGGSLMESALFFAIGFSPVDLCLFLESALFDSVESLGLPVMNLDRGGCSPGFNCLIFLGLPDLDMFPYSIPKDGMFGKAGVCLLLKLLHLITCMPDNFNLNLTYLVYVTQVYQV